MKRKIIADSCCDTTAELRERLGIEIVPLTITISEKSYVDRELEIPRLLKEIAGSKEPARTACPSPMEYMEAFGDCDECFAVTLSDKLSGLYASAMAAADISAEKRPDKRIHIFNSLSASAGQTLIALKIKELIDQKLDFEEIVKKVEHFISGMKTFFVLENLETLRKNGRLGALPAILASVLSIRPIMGEDGKGNIKQVEKVRGTQKALVRLAEIIKETVVNAAEKTLVISHCNNHERAVVFKELVEKLVSFKETLLMPTGGISTVYANDGGIVVAF